jgi:hypothetical protein
VIFMVSKFALLFQNFNLYRCIKERDIDDAEFVAGAPDWLFGRGCVKSLLSAPSALKHLSGLQASGGGGGGGGGAGGGAGQETCDAPAATPGVANHAPGGAGVGSGLVAIHMAETYFQRSLTFLKAPPTLAVYSYNRPATHH